MRRRIWHPVFAVFLSFILVVSGISWPGATTVTAAPANLENARIELSVNKTTVDSGEWFTYTLGYSFSSTLDSDEFSNVKVNLQLPPGVEMLQWFSDAVDAPEVTPQADGSTLLAFPLLQDPAAGSAYTLQINTKFANYITPNGTTGTATAYISAPPVTPGDPDNPNPPQRKDAVPVNVTSHASSDWELKKNKLAPYPDPQPGSDVKYELVFINKNTSDVGNLAVTDVTIVDQLPPEAQEPIIASDGGVYNPGNRTVTWTFGSEIIKEGKRVTVQARFPELAAPDTLVGKTITNNATVTYTPLNEGQDTKSAFVDVAFIGTPADIGSGIHKNVYAHHRQINRGQKVDFFVGGIGNRTNETLENYNDGAGNIRAAANVVDMTPPSFSLVEIATGTFDGIANYGVQFTLVDNPQEEDWSPEAIVGAAASQVVAAPAGAKGVRFLFHGPLPISFQQSQDFKLTYEHDGGAVVGGLDKRTNTATLSYWFQGAWKTGSDSDDVYLYEPRPLVDLSKSVINGSSHIPGNIVEYRIKVKNVAFEDKGEVLKQPVVIDVLPAGLEYVPGSAKLENPVGLTGTSPLAEAITTGLTESYNYGNSPTNFTSMVRFDLGAGAELAKDGSFEIVLKAKVKESTLAGDLPNRVELVSANLYINDYRFPGGAIEPGKDVNNHSELGTNQHLVYAYSPIYVNEYARVSSVKWVRGELDIAEGNDQWKKGQTADDIARTTPGGRVDYKLVVKNDGNVPITNIEIVDVFPKQGDRGVIANQARDSKWNTTLTGPISIPGATVYYSIAPDVTMDTTTGWSTTPPADLSKVTATKFVFSGATINPGDPPMEVVWHMRAPIGAPVDEVAWNSFGFKSTTASGQSIPAAEPPKVGVKVVANTLGEIGNYVWADLDGDGLQDDGVNWGSYTVNGKKPYGPDGKTGVNGVKVQLLDALNNVLQTTVTTDDQAGNPGYYLFTHLPAGTYKVKFFMPSEAVGIAHTGTTAPFTGWTIKEAGVDREIDSDITGNGDVTTGDIILGHGQKRYDIDAGLLTKPGQIGDYVWFDADWDGIQDAGEVAIAGAKVRLFKQVGNNVTKATDVNGTEVAEQTTGVTGAYLFTNLPPGRYIVEFEAPSGYIYTLKTQGSDRTVDSNIGTGVRANIQDPFNPVQRTEIFTLELAETNLTIDAGLVDKAAQTASLGDTVWIDWNNSGRQDDNTAGWEAQKYTQGATVRLFKGGSQIAVTETDSDGKYLFEHLVPGDYEVTVDKPAGYMFSKRFVQGAANAAASNNDSDIDATGKSGTITLAAGQHQPNIDIGLVPLASIGDYVWMDRDEDGMQNEAASDGVNGVVVKLFNADGTPVMSSGTQRTETTATVGGKKGYYKFTNLEPDKGYYVEFVLPSGYIFTDRQKAGVPADKDSDAKTSDVVTPRPDQYIETLDAGVIKLSAIGDYVWIDMGLKGLQDDTWVDWNGNGVKDAGEEDPGINGIKVELLQEDGVTLAKDAFGNTMVTYTKTENGKKGHYLFDDLRSGKYKVRFSRPDANPALDAQFEEWTIKAAGSDTAKDSDVPAGKTATATTDTITLGVDERNLTIDAGLLPPRGKIGDYVWLDEEWDGLQKGVGNEQAVTGVDVYLLNGNGQRIKDSNGHDIKTTTNANGWYEFGNLLPGRYGVEFELPSTLPQAYLFTKYKEGANGEIDSDAIVPLNFRTVHRAKTASVNLPLGKFDLTLDAGLIAAAAIGDTIWLDDADSGKQEAGNNTKYTGSVTVTLKDEGGTTIDTIVTTDGTYLFDYLYPGKYQVEFSLPSGYKFSKKNQGADGAIDSDVNSAGKTDIIELSIGERNLNVDAGLVKLASLGDYVWLDINENGRQDNGELGVAGVTVRLLDGTGAQVKYEYGPTPGADAITVTDTNGAYKFENLVPGNYIVEFVAPASYLFTTKHASIGGTPVDGALNSDADQTTGRTQAITLQRGEENLTIDAGLVQLSSIGDYVWIDLNGNGIQDEVGIDWNGNGTIDPNDPLEADAGVNGVKVDLLNSAGNVINTVYTKNHPNTGKKGYYIFEGLRSGTYQVQFHLPDAALLATLGLTGKPFPGWTKQGENDGNPDPAKRDSDPIAATGLTAPFVLGYHTHLPDIDAGLLPPLGRIGDYVWLDEQGNGIQTGLPSEEGVQGIEVYLLDSNGNRLQKNSADIKTVTDADGWYDFNGLLPGQYKVEFVIPSNMKYLFTKSGGTVDTARDSNPIVPTAFRTVHSAITPTIDLGLGETDLTIDAGLVVAGAIGDTIWLDNADTGKQESGNNTKYTGPVEVTLEDNAGNVIDTITTTDGTYLFDYLYPGIYKVKFELPNGYKFSKLQQGGNDAIDSDAGNDGYTRAITLGKGERNLNVDAGLVKLASLGDYVWHDGNENGKQDTGELGIAGVKVNLLDGSGNPVQYVYGPDAGKVATVTTDADGKYRFDNLIPGSYIVEFVRPAHYVFTTQNAAGVALADNSDANTATGRTVAVTLVAGQHNPDIDAGLIKLSSIGDYVWIDIDGDGIQDGKGIDWDGDGTIDPNNPLEADAGINGIQVDLLNSAGTVIASVTTQDHPVTGKKGYYLFDDLRSGTYRVKFHLPDAALRASLGIDVEFPGWTVKLATDGNANPEARDSDVNPSGADKGITDNIVLGVDHHIRTIDAGLLPPLGKIGDYVWHDADWNGVQDENDTAGVNGVTVYLLDGNGDRVVVGGAEVSTTTAAKDGKPGYYEFDGLLPGHYGVEFSIASLPNYLFTKQGATLAPVPDFKLDSNAIVPAQYRTVHTAKTPIIALGLGEINHTIDAGVIRGASVGDTIWIDNSNTGIQTGSDTLYNGPIDVVLEDGSGTKLAELTTSTGKYLFDYLYPGTYRVKFSLPPTGYMYAKPQQGADDNVDSDAAADGYTRTVTVGEGEANLRLDLGLVPLASLGDRVWMDKNLNGRQDKDDAGNYTEAGVPGVTVRLLDAAGNPISYSYGPLKGQLVQATTGANGEYRFDNLVPGVAYQVEFVRPAHYVFTTGHAAGVAADVDSDALAATNDAAVARSAAITLLPGEYNSTIDAGLIKLVNLGDRVWHDVNGNGVQDAGEPDLPNATVELYDEAGTLLDTETTNANGYYQFTDLYPGKYRVKFVTDSVYPQYVLTRPLDPAATADTDSDAAPDGLTAIITLVAGEDRDDIDAGLTEPAAIGDYVWFDSNRNGVQDAGEAGRNEVIVELYDENNAKIGEQKTRAHNGKDGYYLFDRLVPGKYRVKFIAPAGLMFTMKHAGADAAKDSDAANNGDSEFVTLAPGELNDTIDAGLYSVPAGMHFTSLGDYVWHDLNKDGLQGADEPGVNGVTVHLYNENGAVIGTTVTASKGGKPGYYLFENLIAGDKYQVRFELPSGYKFTLPNVGNDINANSKADANGATALVQVWAGAPNLTFDAGLVKLETGSIGDFVWNDWNGNGIQDGGEPGVNGVTVRLYDSEGKLVKTTQTAPLNGKNGYYLFEDLVLGDYTVEFVLPDGYTFTTRQAGNDPARDSDARANGWTSTIKLAEGEHIRTIDAGLIAPPVDPAQTGSIGDYVWYDKNGNGQQDEGERGVNGVTVRLYDSAGKLVATTVTADNGAGKRGYYLFTDLQPGNYTVEFVLPGGLKFTAQYAGTDTARDSDAGAGGRSGIIALGEGRHILTIDAGLIIDKDSAVPLEIPLEELDDSEVPTGVPNLDDEDEEHAEETTPTKPIPSQPDGGDDDGGTATTPTAPTTPTVPQTPPSGQQAGTLPKTGEDAPITPWIGGAMILAALYLWIRRPKQMASKK